MSAFRQKLKNISFIFAHMKFKRVHTTYVMRAFNSVNGGSLEIGWTLETLDNLFDNLFSKKLGCFSCNK